MKKFMPALAVILFACFSEMAYAQTGVSTTVGNKKATGKTEQALMKITAELTEASKRSDRKVFEKYFAESYFSTNVDGVLRTKAEILENINPAAPVDDARTDFEDIQVVEQGNTAILSVRFNNREELAGRTFTQSYRATDVFMRQEGQWKILSRHLSIIPAAKTAAKIDPAIYDAYVGQYEISGDNAFTITREGDKLLGEFAGNKNKIQLLPESETAFFEKGRRRQTVFVKDEQGKVSHLVHRLSDGQEINRKKMK